MYRNVTHELRHLIPENTLGLRYDIKQKDDGDLIFEVSREGYFLGLTHLWRFSILDATRTHKVETVKARHVNKAIKSLQKRGTIPNK